MQSIKFRKLTVILHRYIGIVVGLILIVVGLTGSLLVFNTEIQQFMVAQKFGSVVPQKQRVVSVMNYSRELYGHV